MNPPLTPLGMFDHSITPSIYFGNVSSTQSSMLNNISNITATIQPEHNGPPSSPYTVTQMIIIGTIFIVLSLLTVIGNFMVRRFKH